MTHTGGIQPSFKYALEEGIEAREASLLLFFWGGEKSMFSFCYCEIRCLLKSDHSRQIASDICVLSTRVAITCGMPSACPDAALLSVCPEAALLIVSETLLGFLHVWKNLLTRVYNLKSHSASSKDTLTGTDCSRAFDGRNLCGNIRWVYYSGAEVLTH